MDETPRQDFETPTTAADSVLESYGIGIPKFEDMPEDLRKLNGKVKEATQPGPQSLEQRTKQETATIRDHQTEIAAQMAKEYAPWMQKVAEYVGKKGIVGIETLAKIPLKRLEKECAVYDQAIDAHTQKVAEYNRKVGELKAKVLSDTSVVQGLVRRIEWAEGELDKLDSAERGAKEEILATSNGDKYSKIQQERTKYQTQIDQDRAATFRIGRNIRVNDGLVSRYQRTSYALQDRLELLQDASISANYWKAQFELLTDKNLSPTQVMKLVNEATVRETVRKGIGAAIENSEAEISGMFRDKIGEGNAPGASGYSSRDRQEAKRRFDKMVTQVNTIAESYIAR